MPPRRSMTVALCGAALAALASGAAAAGAVDAAGAEPATPPDRPVPGRIEEVVVFAHPLSAEGLALSSDILEGDDLARQLQSSIGETVGNLPGVNAANFGQAASRPVIHGLSGPRVRMLEDRIDSLDVSVTSADHAVTIEPFVADRIEVLKGPSALIYGSGAIGGVVDVHTGRIPHRPAERALLGRVEVRRGDNGDRETAAARLDGGTGVLAWHLDGFRREADPYEIPGFAESARLRASEGDDASPVRGRLPGSQLDVRGGAGGLSITGERGFLGAAVSSTDARYGLPGGHAEEAGAPQDATPTLDLEQTRIDLESGLADPLPGFASMNVRVGINDYRHREIEPDGAVATVFDNDAVEARIELTHEPLRDWTGALGLQYTDREFSAIGEEAFIAPVDTRAIGAFWVGQRSLPRFDVEAGLRLETVSLDASDGRDRDFTAYAGSLGIVVPFGGAWSLGLLADYSARAPIAEELFSNGPHLATRAFEIGNASLDEERALSLSGNLRYAGERWSLDTTLYYNAFSDFIYEAATGAVEDDLPVFVYTQDDATFVGLDVEVRTTLLETERGTLELHAQFDTVSGEVDVAGNGDLPRIPADRYGIGLSGRWGAVRAEVDHTWVRDQFDVADFELPTDGYRDLSALVGVDVPFAGSRVTLFLQGRNLSDDDQRQHASFIKDFAPMPGRTVEAGLRATF